MQDVHVKICRWQRYPDDAQYHDDHAGNRPSYRLEARPSQNGKTRQKPGVYNNTGLKHRIPLYAFDVSEKGVYPRCKNEKQCSQKDNDSHCSENSCPPYVDHALIQSPAEVLADHGDHGRADREYREDDGLIEPPVQGKSGERQGVDTDHEPVEEQETDGHCHLACCLGKAHGNNFFYDVFIHIAKLPLNRHKRLFFEKDTEYVYRCDELSDYSCKTGAPYSQPQDEYAQRIEDDIGHGRDDHGLHDLFHEPLALQYAVEHVAHQHERTRRYHEPEILERVRVVIAGCTEDAHEFFIEDVRKRDEQNRKGNTDEEARLGRAVEHAPVLFADGSGDKRAHPDQYAGSERYDEKYEGKYHARSAHI